MSKEEFGIIISQTMSQIKKTLLPPDLQIAALLAAAENLMLENKALYSKAYINNMQFAMKRTAKFFPEFFTAIERDRTSKQ